MRPLRLGTRGSPLALWQARAVVAAIERAGGPPCDTIVIRTSGDRPSETPLSLAGGKRLFVKEIEDALLAGEIDLAVHSAKDMPAAPIDGLAIVAALPREEPWDALVLPAGREAPATDVCSFVCGLGRAPRVGTGSVRRTAQLRRLMPGARFADIRGNLETRLRKLDAGDHDLLVLAAAGLRRLGLADRITSLLPVTACVPAPGQGIVAVEARADDDEVGRLLDRASHGPTRAALAAERALVAALGGGCQLPLGAVALPEGDRLVLQAIVASPDGGRALRREERGSLDEAAALGRRVAADLLADGAGAILDETRRIHAGVEDERP